MPHKDQAMLVACKQAWYINNKDEVNKRSKQWREDNKYRQTQLKLEIMTHYSGGTPKCACLMCPLPEKDIRFLTMDHVNNDGAIQRAEIGNGYKLYRWLKKNNFPIDMQVLCFDCNCGKNVNGGICPHIEGLNYAD